ncbi:uncharacterized protein B0I36DRAFT_393140, partial [Microdochium trichocladiopsis]
SLHTSQHNTTLHTTQVTIPSTSRDLLPSRVPSFAQSLSTLLCRRTAHLKITMSIPTVVHHIHEEPATEVAQGTSIRTTTVDLFLPDGLSPGIDQYYCTGHWMAVGAGNKDGYETYAGVPFMTPAREVTNGSLGAKPPHRWVFFNIGGFRAGAYKFHVTASRKEDNQPIFRTGTIMTVLVVADSDDDDKISGCGRTTTKDALKSDEEDTDYDSESWSDDEDDVPSPAQGLNEQTTSQQA